MDDHLRVLPISSHLRDLQPVPPPSTDTPLSPQDQELKDLKESLKDSPPIGLLVDLCKTLDQVSIFIQLQRCDLTPLKVIPFSTVTLNELVYNLLAKQYFSARFGKKCLTLYTPSGHIHMPLHLDLYVA